MNKRKGLKDIGGSDDQSVKFSLRELSELKHTGESMLKCDFVDNKFINDDQLNIARGQRAQIESSTRNFFDTIPEAVVEGISIGLLTYDDMLATGIRITNDSSEPIMGTLNDPRMGTIDPSKKCATCSQTYTDCSGHAGYIPLPEPRLHPLYIRYIIHILKIVCNSCSNLLLTKEQLKEKGILNFSGIDRLKLIEEEVKNIPCLKKLDSNIEKCKSKYIFKVKESNEKKKIIYTYGKNENEYELKPETVFDILDNISDEDAKLMGFTENNHPRNLILRGLYVIPPCSRPDAYRDKKKTTHDITRAYEFILKEIKKINEYKNDKQKETEYITALNSLDSYIFHLMDNSDGKLTLGTRKPLETIKQKINRKKGIVRRLLMGKRTDYSGRAVASLGTDLRFGQVGISKELAKFLSKREIVTTENISRLNALLQEGKITRFERGSGNYRGSFIVVNDKNKEKITLNIGDKVERWLQNGDYVIFARNPSQHKQSMMSAEVVLIDDKVIKLHMAYTTPLNADFDGDEINLFSVLEEESNRELREIMNVKKCLMNAQNNNPSMGLVYDAVTGSYIMTQDDTVVDPEDFQFYLEKLVVPIDLEDLYKRLKFFGINKDSGKALFSIFLPRDFFYQQGNVLIQNGILTKGVIGKEHIGVTENSIVKAIFSDYDEETTSNFISNVNFVLNEYLVRRGFTIGIKDCLPTSKQARKEVADLITKAKLEVEAVSGGVSDIMSEDIIEKNVLGKLGNLNNEVGKKLRDLYPSENAFKVMSLSGAKGNDSNIGNISGLLGQQIIQNERPKMNMTKGRRCLPVFEEDSLDPEARGLCINSFLTGLTPAEFFFHASNSRESSLSRANNVPVVGSFRRQIIKQVEDLTVYPDGTVRNFAGEVIQFIYGNDGIDGTRVEKNRTEIGKFATFINISRIVGKLNNEYGFYLKDGKWVKYKN